MSKKGIRNFCNVNKFNRKKINKLANTMLSEWKQIRRWTCQLPYGNK